MSNPQPVDTQDFSIVKFLNQRLQTLIQTTQIAQRIGHGKIIFEFRVADGKVVYSEPTVTLGIKEV